MNELPELIITSRTQSPETIRKIMEDRGYKVDSAESQSDQPAEAVVEVPETPEVKEPPEEAPAEEAKPAEEAGEEESEEGKKAEEKKKEAGSAKYKRQRDEARAKADDLEAKLRETEAKIAAGLVAEPAKVEEPPKVEPKPQPKWEDFENEPDQLAAFTNALTDWKLDERDARKAQQQREDTESQKQRDTAAKAKADAEALIKDRTDRWKTQQVAARDKFDDYDEVMTTVKMDKDSLPSEIMASIAVDLDNGVELAYWLAKNPEHQKRIAQATQLPENATPRDVHLAMLRCTREFSKVEDLMAKEQAESETGDREVPADPPEPKETKPAPQASAPAPVKPKPVPVKPVGNRGGMAPKNILDLPPEELRLVSSDDYRRARGM